MEINIWVSEKEKGKKTIEKALKKQYDKDTYLIGEDHNYKIEEAYIESDGELYLSANGSDGLYYSITIPFQEWFYEALRFDAFDKLDGIFAEKKKDMLKCQKKLTALQNKYIRLKNE